MASHETTVSASLSVSAGATVPFSGLLNNSANFSLEKGSQSKVQKLLEKVVDKDIDISTEDETLTVVKGVAMTLPYTVIVSQPGKEKEVNDIVQAEFRKANDVINGWNPNSEISRFNKHGVEKKFKPSQLLLDMFATVDKTYSITSGRFDPTIGILMIAFENCIGELQRPPQPSELMRYKHAMGWTKKIKQKKGNIFRLNANTIVDLDGISKGFVIDRIVAALVQRGYSNCFVDWAGDAKSAGKHPTGRYWRSALVGPPALQRVFKHWAESSLNEMLDDGDVQFMVNFVTDRRNSSVACSGDYFAVQKFGFHHIADLEERTLLKASPNAVGSVMIASESCAVADSIATAAMTYSSAERVVKSLDAIKNSMPNLIDAYCVFGRDGSTFKYEKKEGDYLTAADRKSKDAPGEDTAVEEVRVTTYNYAQHIATECGFVETTVEFDSVKYKTDSFTSCSINRELLDQLITMLLPAKFVEKASLDPESEYNSLSCEVFSSQASQPGSSPSAIKTGIIVQLRFTEVIPVEEFKLVVAKIVDVDVGRFTKIRYNRKNGAFAPHDLELPVARAKFPTISVDDKAITLFRNIPSLVWIVVIPSPSSEYVGLTATSVIAPVVAKDLLLFNVMHSSAFYAELGGRGSKLWAYALSLRSVPTASKLLKNAAITEREKALLQRDAMFAAECQIRSTSNVQDHTVVVSQVKQLEENRDKKQSYCGWLGGKHVAI